MATGDTLSRFVSQCNEPPQGNIATPDRNDSHPVLDFDDAVNESAVFADVMPQHYGGGGVSVRLTIAMSSAVSGDVDFDVAFEKITNLSGDTFATAKSIDNTTVPGTTHDVFVVTVSFANGAEMDNVVAGDPFRLKVTRDAVSDTASGDAELRFVEIRES